MKQVIRLTAQVLTLVSAAGFLSAQGYAVGDTVEDFQSPICANGEGDFHLYDYNGDVNGGDYSVIWVTFFASW
ncbi:MAG: hypothetical protein ACE5GH_04405 [Fidelibacterota bacterium]